MYVYTSISNNHISIFMVDKYMLAIAEKAFMIVRIEIEINDSLFTVLIH